MLQQLAQQATATFCMVFGLLGCATNDVTGQDELRLMNQAEEIRLGEKQYPQLIQQSGGRYVADPALTSYVQSVGQRLAQVADRDLPYEFVVINESDWNAWALPGGKIGINRGLLLAMQSEAELAAVLAHEIVHAAAGHGANQTAATQLGRLGLDVLGALIDNPAARQASAQVGSLVLGGARAKFSRSDELEADRFGMEYMRRAGYDLQGAVELQERFLAKSEGGSTVSLFATHPPSADRVATNRLLADRTTGGRRGEQAYLAATQSLREAAAGYEALAQGIKAYLDDDFKAALSLADKALKLDSREPAFHELRGFALLGLERFEEGLASANQAVRLNPNYYRHYNLRAQLYQGMGRSLDARSDYQISLSIFPTEEAQAFLDRS